MPHVAYGLKGKKDETTTWHWFHIKSISRLCITSDSRSHYIHLMEAVFEDYSIMEAVFGYFLIVLPAPPPFRQYYCTFHNYSNVVSCSLYTKWKQYKNTNQHKFVICFCVLKIPQGVHYKSLPFPESGIMGMAFLMRTSHKINPDWLICPRCNVYSNIASVIL